ncbi:MAG: hypothetical protein ACI957_004868, partial [Verrucomicrobiales bacterium]
TLKAHSCPGSRAFLQRIDRAKLLDPLGLFTILC